MTGWYGQVLPGVHAWSDILHVTLRSQIAFSGLFVQVSVCGLQIVIVQVARMIYAAVLFRPRTVCLTGKDYYLELAPPPLV